MAEYELTQDTKRFRQTTVYRIRRLYDGVLGGFVAGRQNLSPEGDAWISDNAIVMDDARVLENALVSGNSVVYGSARICGQSRITNNSRVFDAMIDGGVTVCGNAIIATKGIISGYGTVGTNANIRASVTLISDIPLPIQIRNVTITNPLVLTDHVLSCNDYIYVAYGHSSITVTRHGLGVYHPAWSRISGPPWHHHLDMLAPCCELPQQLPLPTTGLRPVLVAVIAMARQLWSEEIRPGPGPRQTRDTTNRYQRYIELQQPEQCG